MYCTITSCIEQSACAVLVHVLIRVTYTYSLLHTHNTHIDYVINITAAIADEHLITIRERTSLLPTPQCFVAVKILRNILTNLTQFLPLIASDILHI